MCVFCSEFNSEQNGRYEHVPNTVFNDVKFIFKLKAIGIRLIHIVVIDDNVCIEI